MCLDGYVVMFVFVEVLWFGDLGCYCLFRVDLGWYGVFLFVLVKWRRVGGLFVSWIGGSFWMNFGCFVVLGIGYGIGDCCCWLYVGWGGWIVLFDGCLEVLWWFGILLWVVDLRYVC